MKVFIHILLWISNLAFHIENHKKRILKVYPKKIITKQGKTYICAKMFIVALFIIMKNQNKQMPNNREFYKQIMTFYTLIYFMTSKSYNFKYCANTEIFHTIYSTNIYWVYVPSSELTAASKTYESSCAIKYNHR